MKTTMKFCNTFWVHDMNKRIEKLAIECYQAPEFDYKKFAELIVKECMEQVWYTREDGINGNVSEVIKDRIKQHFGVEE